MLDPAENGYPGGESFADVYQRVSVALDELLSLTPARASSSWPTMSSTALTLPGLMGLAPDQARQVTLDNCGISVVVCEGDSISVSTLNAAFHLKNIAA